MSNNEYFAVYDELMYERHEVEEIYEQFLDCQVCYDTGMDENSPCYCEFGRSLIVNVRTVGA